MRVLLAAAVLLLVAGCKATTFHDQMDFGIQVQGIVMPEEIAAGQPLTIRFLGEVGPTTCHRFLEFRSESTGSRLNIAAIGRYQASPGVRCEPIPTFLTEEHTYRHTGPMSDPFRVVVYQPDGPPIDREVRVR
jgi:hypothetical protein